MEQVTALGFGVNSRTDGHDYFDVARGFAPRRGTPPQNLMSELDADYVPQHTKIPLSWKPQQDLHKEFTANKCRS